MQSLRGRPSEHRAINAVKRTMTRTPNSQFRSVKCRHHATRVAAFAIENVKMTGVIPVDQERPEVPVWKRLDIRQNGIDAEPD